MKHIVMILVENGGSVLGAEVGARVGRETRRRQQAEEMADAIRPHLKEGRVVHVVPLTEMVKANLEAYNTPYSQ